VYAIQIFRSLVLFVVAAGPILPHIYGLLLASTICLAIVSTLLASEFLDISPNQLVI
jgi:hypothetical protein